MTSIVHKAPRRFQSLASKLLVFLWLPCTLVPISLLMAGHLLTLPPPAISAALRHSLQTDASAAPSPNGWFVLHILAEHCACSRRILGHLIDRGPDPTVSEKVVLIGDDLDFRQRLAARGFALETLSAERLHDQYGVDGAPILLVLNPQGGVAYSGGYTDRQGGEPREVEILTALRRGAHPAPLPLFGCAVSRELQRKLDPLGLKYGLSTSSER